jgi:nucleoside-diphosphate-sugar epimerase
MTGLSGYIGGQLAVDLSRKHPEIQLVGLVRTDEQARIIKSKLPEVKTVKGDLGSLDILLEEARKSDIVIQAADCDNVAVAETLIKGLAAGGKGRSFIQVSGCASTAEATNGYGQKSTRIFDDIKDVVEITNFDSTHIHWDADQAVIREGKATGVNIALVEPVQVYGAGEGPINQISYSLWLEDAIVKHGKGFTVGEGKNVWGAIHVKDVSAAIIMLLEDALRSEGPKMTWGPEAVYYVEEGEYAYADIVPKVVQILKKQGLIQNEEIEQISAEEANTLHPMGGFAWGTNSRCKGSRLRSFGWKPVAGSLWDIFDSRLN